MIPSISYDQHDIIRWIIELHLGGQPVHCDPTYSRGVFYRPDDIEEPGYKFDLHPQAPGVVQHDVRDPLPISSLRSIMFDPPFLAFSRNKEDVSVIKRRFGAAQTMPMLWELYTLALKNFSDALEEGGVLIVKIGDTIESGRQWWSHNHIEQVGRAIGLYKKDEFILLARRRMERTGNYTQRHARKFHCYFLVFEKGASW